MIVLNLPKKGGILSEKYSKMKCSEYAKCLNFAFLLLAKRMHSSAELRAKLRNKYWNCDVDSVVEECKRLNLLDDECFAKCYIQELIQKGYGFFKIRLSLKMKGFSEELINEYIKLFGDVEDELERAKNVALKKIKFWRGNPELKNRVKLKRYLLSKGYSYEIVNLTVEDVYS
jgi:regulatory protein